MQSPERVVPDGAPPGCFGKALNLSDRDDRREAAREARAEFKEGSHHARAVFGARRDLCELLDACRYDPEIMDVTCIEVRDTVTLEGEFVEDTLDWYAQHEDGSVWYFGEISFNYEDGEIADLEGSWKAGVDGAKPGVVMQGTPVIGDAYRQEWLLGEAEDAGQILALDETVTVPAGTFSGCLKTLDINPHDPELVEHKLFAPGVGFVFEIKPDEGETVELISVVGP